VALLRDAYDECVAGVDAELGRLVCRLRDLGCLQDTLLIITSDHGEHLGEHGLMGHVNDLYMELLHVPLLMLHPSRVPGGEVVRAPVSLRDLPMTVMDLI